MLRTAARFLVVLLLAAGMFAQLAGSATAQDEASTDEATGAASETGTVDDSGVPPVGYIYIHVRECPPGALDAFTDCHPDGIPNVLVEVFTDGDTELYSCTTDEDGNCVVEVSGAGPYFGWDYTDATLVGVYCSYEADLGTETYIDLTLGMTFDPTTPGTAIYCDIYRLGEASDGGSSDPGSGDDVADGGDTGDGGTDAIAFPDTGVAGTSGSGSEALAIGGALAIAALSFAARRRVMR